jgi:hypothetical protein
MKIKQLDAGIVLCEDPGCDRSAIYLFIQTNPQLMCAAYCEGHGVPFAERFQLALPPTPEVRSKPERARYPTSRV